MVPKICARTNSAMMGDAVASSDKKADEKVISEWGRCRAPDAQEQRHVQI